MKMILLTAFVTLAVAGSAPGQTTTGDDVEQEIRKLDLKEADAVLRGDFATVEQLWAPDYTVNNPFNQVVKASAGPIRTGALSYVSFVREIESVQLHGDTVIVMGRETVVPTTGSPDAGRTIRRRYTNIWMKREGRWRLTARHANNIQ